MCKLFFMKIDNEHDKHRINTSKLKQIHPTSPRLQSIPDNRNITS